LVFKFNAGHALQRPTDLPVQALVKYELAINLKTANSARARCSASNPRPRRRGDRITTLFAAAHESPVGTFET
jgi:hypothetical protein